MKMRAGYEAGSGHERQVVVEIGIIDLDGIGLQGGTNEADIFEGDVTEDQDAHYWAGVPVWATWKWLRLSAYFEMPR